MTASPQELAEFRTEAAAWFAANTPRTDDLYLPGNWMEVSDVRQLEALRSWQRKVYEAGFLGLAWPRAYGGGGMPPEFQEIATEEMRRANAPILINAVGLNWAGPVILDLGTEAQMARFIQPILSAEEIWCQGFSEPDHGSDLANLRTRGARAIDGYVFNGSKIWTSLGHFADYMILLARTHADAAQRHRGLSFFLMDMRAPGVAATPIVKLTGERGFAQVFLTDAHASEDARLGAEGEGWAIAMRTLEYERAGRGGQAGGYSLTIPGGEELVALARTAVRDGAPALDDPVVRDECVKLLIEYRSAALNRRRQAIPALCNVRPAALALIEKLHTTELARRAYAFAVGALGAQGACLTDAPRTAAEGLWAHRYFGAYASTIGGGTSEIHRNIIAERVLGLPKS